jgi:hypothetical protein
MLRRFLLQWPRLTFAIAIVAAIFLGTPHSLSAARPPRPPVVYINWKDTGQTITLGSGDELFVKLPIRGYHDDSWNVTKISPNLKLVAGPDELRPAHWSPWTFSFQVFYFQRTAPGTANLVMEPNYFLKPLALKVVDR